MSIDRADLAPSDIGLPAKFAAFRRGQLEIAMSVVESDKRFNMINAPTGAGKSIINATVAKLLGARTLVLTGTKGLQQQLMSDLSSIGLTDIRGQNNYRCVALESGGILEEYGKPNTQCDEGPCHVGIFCAHKKEGGCLYYDQVARAAEAELVVTNYAYWMTAGRFMEPDILGQFDLLILDEAHAAPDELADFCAIHLDSAEVHALLKLGMPILTEGIDVWVNWAIEALGEARKRWTTAKADMLSMTGDKRKATRMMKRLSDLGRKLKDLAQANQWRRGDPARPDVKIPGMATDWIAEQTDNGAVFSPVWAHAYAEDYLFRSIPRVVLSSATLSPSVAKYLGIPPSNLEYREVVSTFAPSRRPLTYIPTTDVDRNMVEGQVRVWINRIDAIVGGRRDRKGIIHTRSYDRARAIMERSRNRDIMITHNSRNARDVIEQFKRAKAPCVLVSPSLETGYDFPGDQCRYQILAKVPFVDSRSSVIQARAKSDKTYLNYLTAMSIIQQVGRGMRSDDDWCESFIIDDHWRWFRAAAKDMFPAWFRKAFREDVSAPTAMIG